MTTLDSSLLTFRTAAPTAPWQGLDRVRSADDMAGVLERVGAALEREGYSRKDRHAVRLSLEEAVVNGLKHGHRHDPAKTVRVWWAVSPSTVKAVVEDQGPGFNPEQVPDPLAPEYCERPSGRGLLLMRSYMTKVSYNHRGNQVTLYKQRSAA
jgi:serine/threonine-protein kinase RsbW